MTPHRGQQQAGMLRVDLVPLWLSSLSTNSVKEEVRAKLEKYQEEAVAMALSKRSGRNEYGGVYGELYRRESITSYKLLPARRFDAVMCWLSSWYLELTDGAEVPF